MIHRFVLGTAGALALAATSGCLVMSGSSTSETGVLISDSTMQQVQIGTTTEQWLIATLGEPTDRQLVEGKDNVEILRYEYSNQKSSGGVVLFVFAGGQEHSTQSVAYFEITDKIVTRAWREAFKEA